jgi:hypothetical protein
MAYLSRPQILDPILSHLREAVAKKTLLDPFLQHLRALALLTKAGPIAKVVHEPSPAPCDRLWRAL